VTILNQLKEFPEPIKSLRLSGLIWGKWSPRWNPKCTVYALASVIGLFSSLQIAAAQRGFSSSFLPLENDPFAATRAIPLSDQGWGLAQEAVWYQEPQRARNSRVPLFSTRTGLV